MWEHRRRICTSYANSVSTQTIPKLPQDLAASFQSLLASAVPCVCGGWHAPQLHGAALGGEAPSAATETHSQLT